MTISALYALFLECSGGVCTDTRKILPNCIFFALKGSNFDGNSFAYTALLQGAKYAVIDCPLHTLPEPPNNKQYVFVPNVLETLQQLATHHRLQLTHTQIIAITGSNGKTTTKELIYSVLSTQYKVQATQGNLNNHIGVPLTLLSLHTNTDFAVIEMGANNPNDIKELSEIAQPNVGIITGIGKAHLQGFKNIKGVLKAKIQLFEYLIKHNKTIFVNANDPYLLQYAQNLPQNQPAQYYGNYAPKSNFTADMVKANPFLCAEIGIYTQKIKLYTHLIGTYNLNNILAATAIATFFEVTTENIKQGLQNYIPKNNRSQIIEKQHNTFILDAYNANPTSMELALANFALIEQPLKMVILGDMLELGEHAYAEHKKIAEQLQNLNFEQVLLVGNCFKQIAQFVPHALCFNTYIEAKAWLNKQVLKNYWVLIKGSRSMQLEKIIEN